MLDMWNDETNTLTEKISQKLKVIYRIWDLTESIVDTAGKFLLDKLICIIIIYYIYRPKILSTYRIW